MPNISAASYICIPVNIAKWGWGYSYSDLVKGPILSAGLLKLSIFILYGYLGTKSPGVPNHHGSAVVRKLNGNLSANFLLSNYYAFTLSNGKYSLRQCCRSIKWLLSNCASLVSLLILRSK